MNTLSVQRTKLRLFVWLFVISSSSYLEAKELRPSSHNIDFAPLVRQLDDIKNKHHIPAYAIVITDDNRLLVDNVRGVTHSGSQKAVSEHAYFRIGSITKNFISLATLMAEKNGKLKLTDKVTDYLGPEQFKNPFRKKHPVTIEQLLEHSAGFADMGRLEFASNDVVSLEQGLSRFAENRSVLWQPGQMHSYSNTSYGLAGRVLEIATKTNINDWLTQAVFKPLGMKTATMGHTELVKANLVPGYQADGVERIPYWNMIYPSLGAINLQPRDMAKLLQFYLKRGAEILTEQQITRLETPVTTLAAEQGLLYGYGLGIYQWYRNGRLFYGHGGDADGYLAHFGYQREINLGYFVVINTFNKQAKQEMQRAIESFLINSASEDTPPETLEIKEQKLASLAGDYFPANTRFGRRSQTKPLR